MATNGAVYYAAQPAPMNNMPIDQFAAAAAAGVGYPPGVPAIYPQTIPYQPFYQYYSVPMVSYYSLLFTYITFNFIKEWNRSIQIIYIVLYYKYVVKSGNFVIY